MIIRSWRGILIPIIYFGIYLWCTGIGITLSSKFWWNEFTITGVVIKAISWLFALYKLNKYRESQSWKTLIDKETGKEFILRKNHTFFWMNAEIWMYIFWIITIIWAINQLVSIINWTFNI